jgi:GDP-L-fucose synthase
MRAPRNPKDTYEEERKKPQNNEYYSISKIQYYKMTMTDSASAPPPNGNPAVVMVTGGSGLVGAGIRDYIEATGARPNETWIFLSSKDGDLRKRDDCERIFEGKKPTHVIHLAAKVGGLFANLAQKVEFFRENILINDNVMECCRIYKVEKLVSFLSTCIFPDKTSYPIDETMLHNGPPHASNEGYAYAKRLIDTMNRAYAEEYGCNFTSIIPTNIYGLHDNFNVEKGHVIPGLIHKCYLAKKNDTPFTIWGSGTPLRQFIYSRDLAELTVWVMREYHDPTPITLSVGEEEEVSIKDVALAVAKAMKFEGEVIFDTTKADGQFKKTACNKKLRKYKPDYDFTSMPDGIQQSVDWFVENYEKVRK